MKKIVLALFLLSSSIFALEWLEDLNTAFLTAKKEQKTVMVLVEGEHCRWCKKMKHRTLSNESVEKRLEQFILVKVMREDTKVMAVLPQVNGVPTIFFMTDQKEALETIVGYFDVTDFTSYIEDVEIKLSHKKGE